MSTVNFIATTQPSTSVTNVKPTAQQTFATPTPPAANTDSTTISQAARDALAAANAGDSAIPANSSPQFKQGMAEKFAGSNAERSKIQNDPANPRWAKSVDDYAQHNFTAGSDVLYDISHVMPGASGNPKIDGILRYSSGEVVTAESKTYATQQTASYQNQLRDMISSEKAKGTASSDILLKIMDQQGEQPARFRAMTAWPIASDFANNQPSASSGGLKA